MRRITGTMFTSIINFIARRQGMQTQSASTREMAMDRLHIYIYMHNTVWCIYMCIHASVTGASPRGRAKTKTYLHRHTYTHTQRTDLHILRHETMVQSVSIRPGFSVWAPHRFYKSQEYIIYALCIKNRKDCCVLRKGLPFQCANALAKYILYYTICTVQAIHICMII